MSLIFGYEKFQEHGDPMPNAFEADIKNNISPINLGWAGYKYPNLGKIRDFELVNNQKKFELYFTTHYIQFSEWFDIQAKKVEEIKEKYYYVIDVFPHSFWESRESRYPKINSQAINDIKNGKSKILVMFCNESLEPIRHDASSILNTWVANYNLPPNSIVLVSGNFSYEHYIKRDNCIKYIPFSIWEHNIRHYPTPKTTKIFEKFIVKKRKRPKVYLCYNRRAKKQRVDLVYKLKLLNILEKGYVSLGNDFEFNIETHPNIPMDFFNSLPMTFDNTDLSVNQANTLIDKDFINSYISIVTETWTTPDRIFPTEKIFKPIMALHPFLVLATPGFLKQMESFGYKTFSQWFDQSYDTEMDLNLRIEKIVKEVTKLCSLSDEQLQNMLVEMLPTLKHNVNNFIERTTNKTFQKQLEEELWK